MWSTTQAQRRRPPVLLGSTAQDGRGAERASAHPYCCSVFPIATATAGRRSLQRMVRRHGVHPANLSPQSLHSRSYLPPGTTVNRMRIACPIARRRLSRLHRSTLVLVEPHFGQRVANKFNRFGCATGLLSPTTQAQRRRPRLSSVATVRRMEGLPIGTGARCRRSLERMVSRHKSHHLYFRNGNTKIPRTAPAHPATSIRTQTEVNSTRIPIRTPKRMMPQMKRAICAGGTFGASGFWSSLMASCSPTRDDAISTTQAQRRRASMPP